MRFFVPKQRLYVVHGVDYEAARRAAFAQTTDAILWLVSSEC